MRANRLVVVLAVTAGSLFAAHTSVTAAPQPTYGHADRMSGVVPVKGHVGKAGHRSPNLSYHGGPVMTTGAAVTAIFWGRNWSDSGFVADKITGLDAFYGGLSRSSYEATNTEYTSSAGHVGTTITYGGHLVDTSPSISRAPKESAILAEVAKMIPHPVANGYYPVYVDAPRGNTGYCAWHSAGVANGVTVQFGFFFNLDGDAGCDPEDTSGQHSQGTAALGNVSGHELSETLTDQHLDAWYDSAGAENSDKCAWTFGTNLLKIGSSQWKIQGNWSNAAYDANNGYVDPSTGSVVRGCIDGTN